MKTALALFAALLLLSSVAHADTYLDFEGLPFTDVSTAGDHTPVAGSVLTNDFAAQGVIFGKAGVSAGVAVVRDSLAPSSGLNSVQGLNAAGIIPGTGSGTGLADIYFSLVGVSNLVSFTVGDAGGDLDVFQIRAYDSADALISSQDLSGVSRFPVTIAAAGIHRVEVDFTGDFGYSLDDLRFQTVIPEPSTVALLLGALGITAIALRRRRS